MQNRLIDEVHGMVAGGRLNLHLQTQEVDEASRNFLAFEAHIIRQLRPD